MSSPFLLVRKPISALRKPIKPQWGGFFKSLTRSLGAGVLLQWDKLAEGLVDMGISLGIETPPEERAGALLLRALARAVSELVLEHQRELPEKVVDDATIEHLDDILDASEIELGPSFLDNPSSVKLPEVVAPLLADWFGKQGVLVGNHEILAFRLRSYFIYAVIAEWRRKPADYKPIIEALSTPFARAAEREHAWREYAAQLRQQVNKPIFGERFGLQQVYVPMRAAYAPKPGSDVRAVFRHTQKAKGMHKGLAVVMLHEYLEAWVRSKDKEDAIRLLSGGPGRGKSSLAKLFAAELAERIRIILIPLFELDLGDNLPDAVDNYMQRQGLPFHGLLTAKSLEEHIVVIFDGLDELTMRGTIGIETARGFLLQVERVLSDLNRERCRLQIIVTGRELAIQGAESALRAPERVLHILPYYIPAKQRDRYTDADELLSVDQRTLWWAKYSKLLDRKDTTSLPAAMAREEIADLTAEPLLCYLIAFGYCAGDLDILSPALDLDLIYSGLLRGVYRRSYDRPYKGLQRLSSFDDFAAVLEEIGLAAWHGRGRTTTIATIRDYCKRNLRLEKLLQEFETNAKAGMASLLLAFYFRQSEDHAVGDPTFEFTHLSFGEYLTARRLVRAIERIANQVTRGDAGDEDGWDERKALKFWLFLCGPSPIEANLIRFLRALIHARPVEDTTEWQRLFCRLIEHMLTQGLPLERLEPRLTYRDEVEYARHAETALFVILDACARVTQAQSAISWPESASFGTWLRRAIPQRQRSFRIEFPEEARGAVAIFAQKQREVLNIQGCFSLLQLNKASLISADLGYATLQGADLSEADLTYADLHHADLTHAQLVKATLQGANLEGAHLERANLKGADLTKANLQGANLQGANLDGANLLCANLEFANLDGATLKSATYTELPNMTRWPNGFDPRDADCVISDERVFLIIYSLTDLFR
jgi:hypothetical protein